MMTKISIYTILLMNLCAVACSNGSEEQNRDHVFKGYEESLEKAKQLQPQLEEAEEKRKKQLEEMMR